MYSCINSVLKSEKSEYVVFIQSRIIGGEPIEQCIVSVIFYTYMHIYIK